MAREATFCFQPETFIPTKAEKKAIEHYASVTKAYNQLRFAPAYIKDKSLNGKFVKLHFDKSKKAIGWKVMEEQNFKKLAGYRKITLNKSIDKKGYTSYSCVLTIKGILEELGIKEDAKFNKLEIKQYRESGHFGNVYDYVILKND